MFRVIFQDSKETPEKQKNKQQTNKQKALTNKQTNKN